MVYRPLKANANCYMLFNEFLKTNDKYLMIYLYAILGAHKKENEKKPFHQELCCAARPSEGTIRWKTVPCVVGVVQFFSVSHCHNNKTGRARWRWKTILWDTHTLTHIHSPPIAAKLISENDKKLNFSFFVFSFQCLHDSLFQQTQKMTGVRRTISHFASHDRMVSTNDDSRKMIFISSCRWRNCALCGCMRLSRNRLQKSSSKCLIWLCECARHGQRTSNHFAMEFLCELCNRN